MAEDEQRRAAEAQAARRVFNASLPRWEYMIVSQRPGRDLTWKQDGLHWPELDRKPAQKVLDWLGEAGWELVSVEGRTFYLKRQRFNPTGTAGPLTSEESEASHQPAG